MQCAYEYEEALALGLTRVGLFGTRFTMQGLFYDKIFAKRGIRLIVPGPEEQENINQKYMSELVQ